MVVGDLPMFSRCGFAGFVLAVVMILPVAAYAGDTVGDTCSGAIDIPGQPPYTANWNFSQSFLGDDGPIGSCNGSGGAAMRESVWFEWTPDADCSATVRLSSNDDKVLLVLQNPCGNFVEVACADAWGAFNTESVTFQAVQGATYFFVVGNFNPTGNTNIFSISLTCDGPPLNDECVGAVPLNCNSAIVADVRFGSILSNDPNAFPCYDSFGHGSLWYSFVPLGTTATVSTESPTTLGISLDSLLEVYSGACGALTQVACNDDISGSNRLSRIELAGLNPNDTYYIRVAAKTPLDMAEYVVSVLCGAPVIAGDECTDPDAVACGSVALADLSVTTSNPTDPVYPCRVNGAGQGVNSRWFEFQAQTTSVRLTTGIVSGGTADDTLLAVYGGFCGSLVQFGCDDDSGPGFLSDVVVNGLVINAIYTVQVSAYDVTDVGVYSLNVECIGLCTACPRNRGDANGDCATNGADLSVLLSQFGQGVTPSTGGDFNGDGLVNGADLSVLLGNFGCN